jgi:hypothetical protein
MPLIFNNKLKNIFYESARILVEQAGKFIGWFLGMFEKGQE